MSTPNLIEIKGFMRENYKQWYVNKFKDEMGKFLKRQELLKLIQEGKHLEWEIPELTFVISSIVSNN